MPLIDYEIVQQQGKKEARLLFPYHNVSLYIFFANHIEIFILHLDIAYLRQKI